MKHIGKLLLLATILSSSLAFGQITPDPEDRENQGQEPLRTQTPEGRPLPFWQRLRVGGGISSLSISNPFQIGISPVVAYQASERAVLGLGVNYFYAQAKIRYNTGQTDKFTANQYGGRLFGLYEFIPNIIPNLFLHGELEGTSAQLYFNGPGRPDSPRKWVTVPLAGLTYSQRVGRLAGINLSALYNLNYNTDTQLVYPSPFVFRISFF